MDMKSLRTFLKSKSPINEASMEVLRKPNGWKGRFSIDPVAHIVLAHTGAPARLIFPLTSNDRAALASTNSLRKVYRIFHLDNPDSNLPAAASLILVDASTNTVKFLDKKKTEEQDKLVWEGRSYKMRQLTVFEDAFYSMQ